MELTLDIVRGSPRDEIVHRHVIDPESSGMTDLGECSYAQDDIILIYEVQSDGSILLPNVTCR
ncbi:hypothetical protein HQ487_04940 [Candidatus Uhrbacteria bacterium]|nr:hypothetical protein [Candidatus Uhrbacteria bacterium]